MPKFKVHYNVKTYWQCVAEVEADNKQGAEQMILDDYWEYEDEGNLMDTECEVGMVEEVE